MPIKTNASFDDSRLNHLLAALSFDEFDRIKPYCELVPLSAGDVLYEPGDQRTHTYFPTTAIVSLLNIAENGTTTQVGVVGNKGLVGCSIIWGGGSEAWRAVVHSDGASVRIKAGDAQAEFKHPGVFHDVLLLYMQAILTQISQTAICNRVHKIEQQVCHWLLVNHDQMATNKLLMTHDLIANMLGVRREGVAVAAGHLQQQGLIKYTRGIITILDRHGLEQACCECYQVVTDEYDRLLGKYLRKKANSA